MTKRNLTKVGTTILKWLAAILAISSLPALREALGDSAALAGSVFVGASALKDTIIVALDYLDDGKRNHSFSVPGATLPLIAAAGIALVLLPSCTVTFDPEGRPVFGIDPAQADQVTDELVDRVNQELAKPPAK